MESFLRKDQKIPYGGIKYDFQKLLVTNAELRLMIFIVKRDNDLELLGNAIENYQHLPTNAKFLFVAYDEKRVFIIQKKEKNYRQQCIRAIAGKVVKYRSVHLISFCVGEEVIALKNRYCSHT